MGQYDRVLVDGKQVTRRMRAAIYEWQEALDRKGIKVNLFVWQGSWRPVTDYSGTTHTGAGVCDIGWVGMGDNDLTRRVLRIGKEVAKGAIFLRGPGERYGNFDMWHFHWCDLDTTGMDDNAKWQVREWREGNNGLDAGVPDPNPWRPDPIRKFNWDAYKRELRLERRIRIWRREIRQRRTRIEDARKTLQGLDRH